MISVMDQGGFCHNYAQKEEAVLDFDFKELHAYPWKKDFYFPDIIYQKGNKYQGIAIKGAVIYVPFPQGEDNPPQMITYFIRSSYE